MTLADWPVDSEYDTIKTNDPDSKKLARSYKKAIKRVLEEINAKDNNYNPDL